MHSPQRRCRPTPVPAQSWKRSSAACTARTSTAIPAAATRWSIPIAACRATGTGRLPAHRFAIPRARTGRFAARTVRRASSSSPSARAHAILRARTANGAVLMGSALLMRRRAAKLDDKLTSWMSQSNAVLPDFQQSPSDGSQTRWQRFHLLRATCLSARRKI